MSKKTLNHSASSPVIPRPDHTLSRTDISENALKVLYRLKKAGYASYLVGGGVRDILLDRHPKDFDIATDALPEQVRALFRNSRIIGRRFRLVHVRFGRDIIEVATFRSHYDEGEDDNEGKVTNGLILRDNVFGTLEEDAWRRDFTINALYYNIADFSVVDYTGAMQDLQKRTLRMIGDPVVRLQEDPVRMLRAIRFAGKLDFQIESGLAMQIKAQGERLELVPPARLFDEVLKLFFSGHAQKTLALLEEYQLLQYLFSQTSACVNAGGYAGRFVQFALRNTDQRLAEDKPVNPAFLFATFLWPAVQEQSQLLQKSDQSALQALHSAGQEVLRSQNIQVAIPKRFSLMMKEIWTFQARLEQRRGKRPLGLLEHKRFRAAYDFMLLRHEAGEELAELCDWWTRFQDVSADERNTMCKSQGGQPRRKRPRSHKKKTDSSTKDGNG